MPPEFVRGSAWLTAAALCLALGFFLWRINAALANALRHRENRAANLRRLGQMAEAEKTEKGTEALRRRVPFYGKLLVLAGLGLGLLGAWLRR
jgi:hypothetical protein